MSFFPWFNTTATSGQSSITLPDIFPLEVTPDFFTLADIKATYTKILTDVFERTFGIPEKISNLLWDNYVQNQSESGLISLLVNAMAEKRDLYLVYVKAVNVLRVADQTEQQQIRLDYSKTGESPLGVFVSFRTYRKTDMLRMYSALEYCVLASFHKTVNVSKAVQIKISKLRESVSLADADIGKNQAVEIANALKAGLDVYLDQSDEITTATPDTTATEKAITFLDSKRAFYLNLPISYISGLQTPGIGSTGEADTRAVERGLKQYYFSIVKPVVNTLFKVETGFKSQDFRQMGNALEALKTFELVDDEILPNDIKKEIVYRLFDLDAPKK